LPPFYEARSRLILEETHKAKQTAAASSAVGNVLLTTSTFTDISGSGRGLNTSSENQMHRGTNGQKRGQPRHNNKGKNGGSRYRGGGHNCGGEQQEGGETPHQQHAWQSPPHPYPWAAYPLWASWN